MRMNIENAARSRDRKIVQFALDNVVNNLKELRDRTAKGDLTSLDEFFEIFVFDDDQDYKRLPPITPTVGINAD